ncbi:MAG: putative DNA binding domain-containing protein [Porphyromonadaceae bacterium]|nr:putative DNA binding domain-containing protein [Porphyromonadaceae bacterium]
MTTLEPQDFIKDGESESFEFKSSFNTETIETLVAFANTKGGTVFVGINNKGVISGVSLNNESVQQWVNEIKSKTSPSLIPDFDIKEVENKSIVLLSIPEYPVKPVSVRGKYYKRVGNSNHLMSTAEVTDLYMRTMQYSWDAYPYPGKTIEDLDMDKIERFANRINEKGRLRISGTPVEIISKMNLVKDGNPTNGAMLLFAKTPLMYDIHAGRLKTSDVILDDRIIRNTLYEAVEETMKYIMSHLKVSYKISSETVIQTTQRSEIFEYPLEALRELVLNSIIHRQYDNVGDIKIKIFDNRITIFNPGKLYGELTIEDLKTDYYQSSARNKLVVEAFFLTGDIEKYGTGFHRVRNAISKYPTMKFKYREIQNGFLTELSYEETSTDNTVDNTVDKTNEEKILDAIRVNPGITQQKLVEITGLTRRGVEWNMQKLKVESVIRRVGGKKHGHWEILSD